jgi:hypothetical protein
MKCILFLVCIAIAGIKSNIWDNIYSNLYNPFPLTLQEYELDLYKLNTNEKIGYVLISPLENQIKCSFNENFQLNPFQNMFNNNKSDNKTLKEIFSIVISFNKNKTFLKLATIKQCKKYIIPVLKHFNVKLLLSSTDIFTYFNYVAENGYYEYALTNPTNFTLENIKELSILSSFLNMDNKDNSLKNKEIVVFKVNARTGNLDEIVIKFNGFEIYHFKISAIRNIKMTESDFNQKYYQDSNCLIANTTNTTNIELFNDIRDFIIKAFK